MASIISGSGLGLLNTSLLVLGGQGGVGSAVHGRSGEQLYVNAATGNLILRNQDDFLAGRGLDIAAVRTYNSRGGWDGDNNDNWRLGVYRKVFQLTGTVNATNSTVTRIDADGSETVYSYSAGKYIATDGDGAHDTLTYDSGIWTWADGSGRVRETYDSGNGGRLTQSSDADGNLLTYTYSGSLVSQVSNANGEITYLDYTNGQLTQIQTIKSGNVTITRTRYEYYTSGDSLGRLWKVSTDLTPADNSISDGDKYVTTYQYEGTSNRVTNIAQSDGTNVSFTYIDAGGGDYRVKTISVLVATGQNRVTTFNYSTGYTDLVDQLGTTTRFHYDSLQRLTKLSSPAVGGITIDTEYVYDSSGNVTQVTRKPQGGSAISQVDYEYDSKGNQTLQRDLAGNTITRLYDATNNQLISETAYLVADPDGAATTGQPSVPLTTRYVYDGELHLRFQISPEGRVTEFRYDGYGNRTASIEYTGNVYTASGTPVEGDLTAWLSGVDKSQSMRVDTAYDFRGLVASVTSYFAVDGNGNGISDGTQSVTEYVYDHLGQLLKSIDPRGVATSGNPNDYVTTYAYDGLGRVISTTNALGKTTVSTYDDAGKKVETTVSNGATAEWLVTTATYNAAGELISLDQSNGASSLGTTLYFYDVNGRLRRTEDPTGVKTHVLYDNAGRKIASIDGDGSLTEYIYNASGLVTKSIRYSNPVSSGGLASLIGAGGVPAEVTLASIRPAIAGDHDQSAWNVYDSAGRLVKSVDALGYVTQNNYDGAGRVVEVIRYANAVTNLATLPDAPSIGQVNPTTSVANDRKIRNFYDGDGKLRGTLDAEGYLTELVYDKAGRQVEAIRYATLTASNQWASGSLDQLRPARVPGDVHSYTRYNARGQIVRQIDGEGYRTDKVYDLAGNVSQSIRFAEKVNGRALALPGTSGSYASTADSAANSITGDLDLRLKVALDDWTPSGYQTLISKWITTGDQRSYTLRVNTSGQLELLWSTSGASATVQQRISTASVSIGDGSTKWISANLDVNNGSGGHDVKFYTSNDGIVWTQLGTTITTSGTTSIFNSSAALELGGHAGGTAYLLDGKIFNAELRSGINGAVVATFNPALDAGIASVSNFYSSTNELWTIQGSATIEALSTAQAFVSEYTFDSLNRVASETNHEGTVTQYVYDDVGNLVKTTKAWNTADVRVLNAKYDRQGRLIGELSGEGSALLTGVTANDDAVWADYGIAHAYDAAGRRISTTDANGRKTVFYYDNDGRLTHAINAMGEVKETKYNALGQVTDVIRYATRIAGTTLSGLSGGLVNATLTSAVSFIANAAVDSKETITYHKNGLSNVSTDALSNTVTDSYNAFGEIATRNQALGALGTLTKTYAYDKRGLLTQTISDQSDINAVATTQYDAFGRAVQITDANGGIRNLSYDKLGRVITVTDPLGHIRSTAYDAIDRTLTTRDALGNITSYSYFYDASTRKVTVTMPEGVVTSAERNRHGDVFKATDGKGNVTTYSYDKNGNLKSVVNSAGTTLKSYDQENLLVETTDANGNKTAYTYDAASRLLTRTVDSGSGHLNLVTSYAYDAKGQGISVTDANGVVTQTEFDRKGQVVRTIVDPSGLNLRTSYTYDGRGKTLTVIEGEGSALPRVTQYVYDKLGRRTQEKLDPSGINVTTTYTYDKNGNVLTRSDGSGGVTKYIYDANDRLTYTVDALGYVKETQYDEEGRITATIQHDLPLTVDSTPTIAEVSAAVSFSTVATTTNAADVSPTQPYTYANTARNDVSTPTTQSVSVTNTSQTTTPPTVQPYPYATAAYNDVASAATQSVTTSVNNPSIIQSANVKDYAWYRSGGYTWGALYTTTGVSLDYYSAATGDYTPTQVKADVYLTSTGAHVSTVYTDVGHWVSEGASDGETGYFFNRWYPVSNWSGQVNLPSGLTPGTYTVVISTRDDAQIDSSSGSYSDWMDGTWATGNTVVVNIGTQINPTTVSWAASTALSGTTPNFKYRVAGSTGGYTTAAVTTSGSNHQVSLSGLAAGNYEYVVEYKDSYNRVLKSTSSTFTSTAGQTTSHSATYNYTQVTSTAVTGSAFTGYITAGEVPAIDRIETTVKDAITNAVVTSAVKTYPEFEAGYNGRINLKASGGSLANGKYNVYVTIYKKDGTIDNRSAIYYEVGPQPAVTQHTVSWAASTAPASTTPNFKYRVQGSGGAYTTVAVASSGGNHQAVIGSIAAGNYEYVVEYKDSYGRVMKTASSTFTVVTNGTVSGNVTFNYSTVTSTAGAGSSITGYVTMSGMPAVSAIDHIDATVRDYYSNSIVSTASTYPEFHPATYDGRLNLKVGSVLADGKYKITALIYKKDGTTETREIALYEVGLQLSTKIEWSNASRPSGATATFSYAAVGSSTYAAATITTNNGINQVRIEELPTGLYNYIVRYYSASGELLREGSGQFSAGGSGAASNNLVFSVGKRQVNTFTYDGLGRLTGSTDAEGFSESYQYDAAGNKTAFTNKKGATWNYAYDGANRLISELSPFVDVSTVTESSGSYSTVTVNGRIETRIEYDAAGNVRYRREAYGRPEARTTEYQYDAAGRQVKTIYPQVGVYNAADSLSTNGITGTVTRNETTVSPTVNVLFDAVGRAIVNQDAAGNYSYKVYDSAGRLGYEIDAERYLTKYSYDALGNKTVVTRYATALNFGAVAGFSAHSAGAAFTAAEVTARLTVNSGTDRAIVTTYDALGRVSQISEPQVYTYDPTAPAGQQYFTAGRTTKYTYNANGQVVKQSVLRHQGANAAISDDDVWVNTYFYYDARGNKTAQVDALGYLTKWEYDETGDVVRQIEYAKALTGSWSESGYPAPVPTPASANDPVGYDREVRYQYDRKNQKVKETRVNAAYTQDTGTASGTPVLTAATGNISTDYGYDGVGNLTRTTQANGATSYTYYDALGRMIATAEPQRTTASSGGVVVMPTVSSNTYFFDVGSVVSTNVQSEESGYQWPGANQVTLNWSSLEAYGTGVVRVRVEYTQKWVYAWGTGPAQVREQVYGSAAANAGVTVSWTDPDGDYGGIHSINRIQVFKSVAGQEILVHDSASDYSAQRVLFAKTHPVDSTVSFQYREKGATSWITASLQSNGHAYWFDTSGLIASQYEYQMSYQRSGSSAYATGTGTFNVAAGSSTGSLNAVPIVESSAIPSYSVQSSAYYQEGDESSAGGWRGSNSVAANWAPLEGWGSDSVKVRIEYITGVYWGGAGVASAIEQTMSSTDGYVGAVINWSDPETNTVYQGVHAITRVQVSKLISGAWVVVRDTAAASGERVVISGKTSGITGLNITGIGTRGVTALGGGRYSVDTSGLARGIYQYTVVGNSSAGGSFEIKNGSAAGPGIQEIGAANSRQLRVYGIPATSSNSVVLSYRRAGDTGPYLTRPFGLSGSDWLASYEDIADGSYEYIINVTGANPGSYSGTFKVMRGAQSLPTVTITGSVVQSLTPLTQRFLDAQGNVVKTVAYAKGAASGNSDITFSVAGLDAANDQTGYAFYDSHGHAIRTVDAELKSRYASYDVMGRVAKEWQATTGHDSTAQNVVKAFDYDKLGHQIGTRSPLSASLIVNEQVAYNGFGEISAKGIDNGWQEFYEYDQAGRLWRTNDKDGVDKVSLYDLDGRSTAAIKSQGVDLSAAGSAATIAGLTNVIRTNTEYDALGRVVKQIQPSFTSAIDLAIPAAGVSWGVSSSAVGSGDESGFNWTGTNTVSVNWNSMAQWGAGSVYVILDYITGIYSWTDESGTHSIGGTAAQRAVSLSAPVGSEGTTFSWYESTVSDGGIAAVTRVRVYKHDANQTQLLIHDRTTSGDYGRMITLPPPARLGATAVFKYKVAGTGTWQTMSLINMGNSLLADVRALAANNYDYQITYTGVGESTPYATQTGTFSVNGATGSISTPDAGKPVVSATVQQTVDRWGNVLSHTDALSKLTSYRYDYLNNLTLEEKPLVDVWGVNGTASLQKPVTTNRYDILGRVIGTTDANNNTKTARYNEVGQLLAEYHPDGGVVRYTYDAFGRQIRVQDANSNITTRVYDRNNRLTSEQRPIGTDTYVYDEAGNRITQTDANGLVTKYWYDVRGLLTKTRLPGGQNTTSTYNSRGLKSGQTDANGNSMAWTYDYFGRLTARTDLGGASFAYSYNQAGQQTAMTSSRGQSQTTAYYENGLLKSVTDNTLGQSTLYEYDGNGNRTREKFVKSGVVQQDNIVTYDALGRVIQAKDNYYTLIYGYDANGNRRFASSNSFNQSNNLQRTDSWYLYDSMNRITLSQGVMIGGVIQKASAAATVQNLVTGYDGSGNRTVSLSGSFVTAAAQGISLGYDGASNRRTATFYESGNLVTEDYNYDGNNRLLSTSRSGNYTSLRTYDAGGRVTESVSYSSPGAISERRINAYNSNGWLTSQTVKDSANTTKSIVSYTAYDNVGNVASYNVQVLTGTAYTNYYSYTYLRFDGYKEQVVSGSSSYFQPGSTTTTYDVNGNPTAVSESFATSRNRSFVTNQSGQILAKTENGATQRYFFLNDNPVGSAGALAASDFDYNYTPVSDRYPATTPGNYVVSQGDTLRSIALTLFGDAKLWYLIADANGLQSDGDLVVGRNLNIPNKITNLHNDYQTFKPYAPSEVIGDTTPTLPDPPPPPASSGGGCGGIGQLLVIIVTVIVAIYAPEMAPEVFKGLNGVQTAMLSAGMGNVAGQAVGNITGVQSGFDFAGFATAVVSAGITRGISDGLKLPNTPGFNTATAARAAIGSVVNQGLNIIVGRQDRFDWKGVAAAAIAAPVAAGLTNAISGRNDFYGTGKEVRVDFGSNLAGGLAGGVAAAAVRQVVYGGGRMNFSQVAADAFGNAVGQALLSDTQSIGQQESRISPWLDSMIAQAVSNSGTVTDVPLRDEGPQLTDHGISYTSDEVEYGVDDDNPDNQIVYNGAGEEITAHDRWNQARNQADSKVTAKYQEHYKRLEDAEARARVDALRAQEASAQNDRELNRTASLVEMNSQSRSGGASWGMSPAIAASLGNSFDLEYGSGSGGPAFVDPAGGRKFSVGGAELLLAGGLNWVGKAVSGVVAIPAAAISMDAAASIQRSVQEQLTYELRTESGRVLAGDLQPLARDVQAAAAYLRAKSEGVFGDGATTLAAGVLEFGLEAGGPVALLRRVGGANSAAAGSGTVWHATPTSGAARSILDNGIDPAFMSANSRFGRGFYVAEQPGTALAELAHHGIHPSTGIRFSVNQDALRVLNLTDQNVARAWGYSGGPISSETQAIGSKAAQSGYNAIRYPSERAAGTNMVVIRDFNDVLSPVMVSPTAP